MPRLSKALFAITLTTIWSSHLAMSNERIAMKGGDLSPAEAAELEKKVEQEPNDIASRSKLLGYFFLKHHDDEKIEAARRKHILWLIENAPENSITGSPYANLDAITDPDGYQEAKAAWLKQVEKQPDNLAILSNAAKFFTLPDRDEAKRLLHMAHELRPESPEWLERLGHLYRLDTNSRSLAERKPAAKTALDYFEQALALSDPRHQATLEYLADCALIAEEYAKARGYAEQMLKLTNGHWNAGNNIHHGNMILGELALIEGNVEEAKVRLLAAGKTSGSPTLGSFGPNMELARKLLEAGEQEVVLEYFELCSKFWDRPELDQWTAAIKAGRTPNFGPNLHY